MKRAVLFTLLIPLLAACGGTATTKNTTKSQGGAATVSAEPSTPAGASLNKAFWHAGFKVTLSDVAVVRPPSPSPGYSPDKMKLIINAVFENLGADNATPYNLDLVLQSGPNSYLNHDSTDEKIPEVPGLQHTNGVIAFYIDSKFSLSSAVLLAGNASGNQARVPLGNSGTAVTLEPQKVAISGTLNQPGAFSMALGGGVLSYDDPKNHQEEKAGESLLTLTFAVTRLGDRGVGLGTDNLILKLPDGTAVAAIRNSTYSVPGNGLTTPDETAQWKFKAADGAYDLIVKGKYGPNYTEQSADFPFNITVGASSSSSSSPAVGGAYPSPSTDSVPQPSPSGH